MTQERKPHAHADLIKAWADGAQIQEYHYSKRNWLDIGMNGAAILWCHHSKYRIKPEPKPDIVQYTVTFGENDLKRDPVFCTPLDLQGARVHKQLHSGDNIVKFTWDGETNKLKSVEIVE